MSSSMVFALGLSITLLAAFAVVCYLNGPLRTQLRGLCGSDERAQFWAALSNTVIVLTPSIFAILDQPAPNSSTPPLLEVAGPLKWGLIGLIGSVLMMGWILSRFIPRTPVRSLNAPGQPLGGAI